MDYRFDRMNPDKVIRLLARQYSRLSSFLSSRDRRSYVIGHLLFSISQTPVMVVLINVLQNKRHVSYYHDGVRNCLILEEDANKGRQRCND